MLLLVACNKPLAVIQLLLQLGAVDVSPVLRCLHWPQSAKCKRSKSACLCCNFCRVYVFCLLLDTVTHILVLDMLAPSACGSRECQCFKADVDTRYL